ncbi:hypothetical protein L0F63_001583 [Massospora cicadina]|nr:hypothetical protein L0F63_001583 [Massospora cicadina]
MISAEEAIRSIADGITDIKKDRDKVANNQVLGRYRFGKKVGPMLMKIGASPNLVFKSVASNAAIDKKNTYRARMAVDEANFTNNGTQEVCVESASFFSEITPNAEFALTYELMDYCYSRYKF